MADIAALLTTWNSLRKWVSDFGASKQRRTDEHTNALMAIYTAATETKSYLANLRRFHKRNLDRERSLSQLWVQAGVRLRTINHDLANRCITKAEYWTDPDTWTPDEIQEAKIGLDNMQSDARELLFK